MTTRKILILAVFGIVFLFTTAFSPRPWSGPNDLYAPWYGMRALLLEGRNPYQSEVTQKIQAAFYGHALQAGENKDQQRFAYPLYSVVLFWPLALLTLQTAEIAGHLITLASCVLLVLLSLRLLRWRMDWALQGATVFLLLSSAPAIRTLKFVQPGTLIALFLVGCLLALKERHYVLAGTLLALATIKPQVAVLPVAWFTLWCLSGWVERRNALYAFASSVAVLIVISEIALPGWEKDFLRQLAAYRQYAGDNSFLTMMAGTVTGSIAGLILWAVTGYVLWMARRRASDTRAFAFASVSVLSVAAVTMPTMAAAHNQILMFPAVLLLFQEVQKFGKILRGFLLSLPLWQPFAVTVGLLSAGLGESAQVIFGIAAPALVIWGMARIGLAEFLSRVIPSQPQTH